MAEAETAAQAWRAGFNTAIELGVFMEQSDEMICIPREPLRNLYEIAEQIGESQRLDALVGELWTAVEHLFLAVPDLGGES